jgi:hypothetical protein
MSVLGMRREKAALSSGCKSHPASAPAESNRSSEIAEAFGKRVTSTLRERGVPHGAFIELGDRSARVGVESRLTSDRLLARDRGRRRLVMVTVLDCLLMQKAVCAVGMGIVVALCHSPSRPLPQACG